MQRTFPAISKSLVLLLAACLLVLPASSQDRPEKRRLFIAGGAMPDSLYMEFAALAGPDVKLVVIPTASSREPNIQRIKDSWNSRGIQHVQILHTRDRDSSLAPGFADPLKSATAVWISGGSQYRIADAYLGTPVEEELFKLLERGGIIGGSSAGAAIQTKVMIRGGNPEPEMATGLDLLPGAIVDQHFLKRNRLARLIAAIRANPELVGYGIDEATAIVVSGDEYKVIGESYVLRIELVDGKIKIDAFENGEVIPTRSN